MNILLNYKQYHWQQNAMKGTVRTRSCEFGHLQCRWQHPATFQLYAIKSIKYNETSFYSVCMEGNDIIFLRRICTKRFNMCPCDSHVTSISRRSWDIMYVIKIRYT